jgi:hypothetical protein
MGWGGGGEEEARLAAYCKVECMILSKNISCRDSYVQASEM